ncbi:MAG: hypothetical protein V3T02_09435, partial [Alphaproteobacteria bacterium]
RELDDGTVVAGIHDTDRIGMWDDLIDGRDDVLMGFRDWYATNPVSRFNPGGDIKSMPPGGWDSFNSVRDFNNKMRELKGYWKYDQADGFSQGHLDLDTVQNRFGDLPNNLPPNWPHWVNAPPAAPPRAPGQRGLLLIVPDAVAPTGREGQPVRPAGHRAFAAQMATGMPSLALAA